MIDCRAKTLVTKVIKVILVTEEFPYLKLAAQCILVIKVMLVILVMCIVKLDSLHGKNTGN